MEIEEALLAYLLTKAGLTALIADRIYPDEAPQNTPLPYVTYMDVSNVPVHTLTGQYEYESPMKQFTAYAATKSAAKSVAKQIKLALKDYQGILSGIEIQYIKLENEMGDLITTSDGTTKIFTHDLEYEINYKKEA